MRVMGTNAWEMETDADFLIDSALEFSDTVKEQGIAQLVGAWLEPDKKVMWCTWLTDDLKGLQAAFEEMNQQTGLTSQLAVAEEMYPSRGGREEREAELLTGAGAS